MTRDYYRCWLLKFIIGLRRLFRYPQYFVKVHNQPKGVQQPHIPLLIGGNGEQVTLKLVAQYGDACHVFGDPATIAHKFAVLKQHGEAIGHDYESIRRATIAFCLIADTGEQAEASCLKP